jgi:hypothetical protein
MAFNINSAYLMTTDSSTNRGGPGDPGTKDGGNLPLTLDCGKLDVLITDPLMHLWFGLASQNSTTSYDVSSETKVMLTSIQKNAPNRIQTDTIANDGVIVRIGSGTGSNPGDYKHFKIGGYDTPNYSSQTGPVTICIDLNDSSEDSTGGTYDNTAVTAWAYGVNGFAMYGTSSAQHFFQRVYLLDTDKGNTNLPNFTGTGNSWATAYNAITGTDYTDKIGAWLVQFGSSYFVPIPFSFGDGAVSAFAFDDSGVTIISPASNASGSENFRLTTQAMRVYADLDNNANNTITLSGTYQWGTAAVWDFDQNDAAVITLSGSYSGMGAFTIGSSVTASGTFNLDGSSKVIIKGADTTGATIQGDADIIGSSPTLVNMVVTGALDFDTAGSYTVNGCTIDEVTNSSGGAVTLNLSNGSSITTNTGPNITINNSVTIEINGVTTGNEPVNYVRCHIEAAAGGPESVGTVLMNEEAQTVDGSTYKTTEPYNYISDQPVIIRARYKGYLPFETTGTITGSGLTITAIWQMDTNYT